MSAAKQCDCCGKFFKPDSVSLVIKIGNWVKVGTTDKVDWIGQSDVCNNCAEAIRDCVKKLGGTDDGKLIQE